MFISLKSLTEMNWTVGNYSIFWHLNCMYSASRTTSKYLTVVQRIKPNQYTARTYVVIIRGLKIYVCHVSDTRHDKSWLPRL
jgi:hypothetical protein